MATSTGQRFGKKFRYSASVRPFLGEISGELLHTEPCILPADGQDTERAWETVNFRQSVEIGRVRAEAQGWFDDERNAWRTGTGIYIERLNIADVLTVGYMQVNPVASYHASRGKPEFSVQSAAFDDVLVHLPQTVQYIAGSDRRFGVLCILDASPKQGAPGIVGDDVSCEVSLGPSGNGLPILVGTVIVRGNLSRPSTLRPQRKPK